MKVATGFLALSLLRYVVGDLTTGVPDSSPPGFEEWISPIVQPAKNVTGDGDWATAVAKAKAFVSKLTLDEKINVTTGADIKERCVGNTGTIARFGWNGLCLEDSPLGVRFTDFVSAFPAAINVASTWDKGLIYARGKAMGQEHRGKGVNVALGPMTNLGRDAAAGRNWEGFGADPYLAGVGTALTTQGYQDIGVIACVKHFIANEQEHYRGQNEAPQIYSSNVDDRTLHELYVWPFAEAVNAGVGAVMCSYNKINQTQACQNSKIITGVLKEELDFQGFVTSDWAALLNGVQPALAGLDMNMPGFIAYGQGPQDESNPDNTTNSWWGSQLIEAVNNGSVPEWRVDDMVTRTLAAWYKMGQDNNYPPPNFDQLTEATYLNGTLVNEHVNVQGDHYKLIRQIDGASTVLLKNNGVLPLDLTRIKRIGIFGSDAGPNPDGPNGCSDRGCDQGTLAMGWGSGTANFPYLIDPSAAINSFINANKPTIPVEAIFNDYNYAQVASVASVADTCLVFVNSDSGEDYITVDGNEGDRNNLTLWHSGDDLINVTASECDNTIVIMHAVGPVLLENWIDHPNVTAVLSAGIPGQETGNAIVDVLFGAVNPSGRLPYTIAKARSDYPADVLYSSTEQTPQITYSEGLNIDYRHFDSAGIVPRFEFGFGLSYTTFAYSGLRISGSVHHRREHPSSTLASESGFSLLPTAVSTSSAPPSNVPSSIAPSIITASSSASGSSSTISGSLSTISGSLSTFSGSFSTISGTSSASAITSSLASSVSINATSSALTGTPTLNATSSVSGNATATGSAPPAISSPAQTHPGGPANLFDDLLTVSYTITNTGGFDGNEVSQLYLGFPKSANEPPRVLRGFDRSFIRRGGSAHVSLTLRRKDVSIWDVIKQQWVIPPGTFTVFVGSSSRKLHLTGTFNT
ncbi:hypothetical protein PUNSTDRAFT_120347 [Punctularia strigosozonata HHB-11173 SS5]|uniref:uncharacterized protein n=1 Tax=Punctularia strigosozonata (strain HHB-11173) TaxID=741275 RepID=UPI0004417CC5|nr:uncharacterized protein PUNSTDRAFT_120347 [Punctularia strigosozonata HHB-11173 SS5]EIN08756.1 hypothetical protein PUNSTDRAFT_120347 [Punctularia strigosozonata HHB-11173 SS5]